MELLEHLAHRGSLLALWIFILCGFSVFSQDSKPRISGDDIELFPRPGFEPIAPHKSVRRDNSNIKPENFRFHDKSRRSLDERLSMGVGEKKISCKPSWGMFKFRVNGKGVVDSCWFDGQLPVKVSNRILDNIRATKGSWILSPGTQETDVAWYVYFYSDTRGRLDRKMNCSSADMELQKVVSFMTSYFQNLFYLLGEDKATMIMATSNDGTLLLH